MRTRPTEDHGGDRRRAADGTGTVADRNEPFVVEPRREAGEMKLHHGRGVDVIGNPLDRNRISEYVADHGAAHSGIRARHTHERFGGGGGLVDRFRKTEKTVEDRVEFRACSEAVSVERRHTEFARTRNCVDRRRRWFRRVVLRLVLRLAQRGEEKKIGCELMVRSERGKTLGAIGKDMPWIWKPDEGRLCNLADRNRIVPRRAGLTHHETSRTTRATWR